MKKKLFDCLIAGDANVDLLIKSKNRLESGKEKLVDEMNLVMGGSSSITAFNLARLGCSVRFISVLGKDLLGQFISERLVSAGVDLSSVRRSERESTGLTIWLLENGRRAGLTYAGTLAMLRASDVRKKDLSSARHLHVGHYFLLNELHVQAPALFARAKRLGLTTSLDCNYDPVERWQSGIWSVLRHTDVFLPNEDEALRLTRCKNVKAAAQELAQFAKVVVVKLGKRGVLVQTQGKSFRVPAEKVRVVDAVGAGDSFNAGFLSEFLRRSELRECAEAGIAAASRCLQKIGGTAAFEAQA